jgi:hypothetical protein
LVKNYQCIKIYLWRIYASGCFKPNSSDVYSFENIEENFLNFYTDSGSDNDNINFYREIKSIFEKVHKFIIEWIPEQAYKTVVIFDVIKGYSEWDFIRFINKKLYFPIGSGFGLVMMQKDNTYEIRKCL